MKKFWLIVDTDIPYTNHFKEKFKVEEPQLSKAIPELFFFHHSFRIGFFVFLLGFIISLFFPLELRVVYLTASLVIFLLAFIAIYLPAYVIAVKILARTKIKLKVATFIIYFTLVILFFISICYQIIPSIPEGVELYLSKK